MPSARLYTVGESGGRDLRPSVRSSRTTHTDRYFASNIHRIQQAIDTAVRYGRKVGITGRSRKKTLPWPKNWVF